MSNKIQKKYKVGLVIGRFQPFHNGHLYLLKESVKIAEKIIIGIGSSNVLDIDNPMSLDDRKKMLEEVLEKENLSGKIIKIVALPDIPDDDKWLAITKENVGNFDVSIGNNDWVNGIFKKAGISIIEVPFFKRYIHEGVKIRNLMKERKPWEDRVPGYLVSQIKSFII